jgi:hypothetical protein
MISRRKGNHAALALFCRELQQTVGRAPELEGAARLQALALEPGADAANLAFDQRRTLDETFDPGGRITDVRE